MKLFGTDFSRKYIIMNWDDYDITVSFYESQTKGIYDVSVRDMKRGNLPIKVESTYPGIIRRIQEAVLLAKMCLKKTIHRITKGCCHFLNAVF